MSGESDHEARILAAWHANAQPWSEAVRRQRIPSRTLATDAAIIAAVMAAHPASVLDLGCGEGWLVRALAQRSLQVTGVDAVGALVALARAQGGGQFETLDYAQLAAGALNQRFDLLVANFSLLGGDSVDTLFAALPRLLHSDGRVLVQTLHPLQACGEQSYVDGWREGSWAGIAGDFGAAAPWYFRTLASWFSLFRRHGLRIDEMQEPLHPHTGRPASVLFAAKLIRRHD